MTLLPLLEERMTSTAHPTTETEPSAAGIWQLGIAFFSRKTILTAAELGVFSTCATEALTLKELSQRLDLHPRGAADFLDALVALGMLTREDGRYRASAVAQRFLDPGQPSYLGRFLRMADARWERLVEGLRTGEAQNGTRDRDTMFTDQYHDTNAWRSYMVGMDYLNAPIGPRLATTFDWGAVTSFVDVGGARGNIASQLVRAHPHLKGAVFDLPPVAPVFEEHIADLGLTGQISFHGGNFFTDPLPSADVVMFGHVLHDWGVKERQALLANAFRSLPPGGIVAVYDPMIDDDRRVKASSLLVSLNMLLATPGGSEYTSAECGSWMTQAGFADPTAIPLDGNDMLVTARTPAAG